MLGQKRLGAMRTASKPERGSGKKPKSTGGRFIGTPLSKDEKLCLQS